MSFVLKRVRLVVPSNKAKPSPQIGQALGSLGINMMKFCKEFNAVTVKYADVRRKREAAAGAGNRALRRDALMPHAGGMAMRVRHRCIAQAPACSSARSRSVLALRMFPFFPPGSSHACEAVQLQ